MSVLKPQTAIALAAFMTLSCTSDQELVTSETNSPIRETRVQTNRSYTNVVSEKPATDFHEEAKLDALFSTSKQSMRTVSEVHEADGMVRKHAVPAMQQSIVIDQSSVPIVNTEKYAEIESGSVVRVSDESISTFSIDVDTGAYANVRRFLNGGSMPPADAVRVEELINYFSYPYAQNDDEDTPFSINTEIGRTPWNDKTHLLHIGLKGYAVDPADIPAANLVFLLDVSGSMNSPDKLGLVKSSIKMLARELSKQDRVSIVVYAGASGVVLEPTPGNNYSVIEQALDRLASGGSTNGQAGIEHAYALAEKEFIEDGVNRIILATDGDFNVGISDIDKLKHLISKKRKTGIALTTLGFGQGNYNDHLMEQLADVGDGAYAYIDTLNEARKVLADELTATLLTIAKDVKIQVEFNPDVVSEYRLLGYENRVLANEDFNNDRVDAGEIGAGHTVTALYEVALRGEGGERNSPKRYTVADNASAQSNEIAEVRLRHKSPGQNTSRLIKQVIHKQATVGSLEETSDNYRFSAAVAAFGQLLRDNKYMENFDLEQVASLAKTAKGLDPFGYRSEFIQLVNLADRLSGPKHAGYRGPDNSEGEG